MDSPFDEAQLSERLDLYFEYSELIEQVEQANSQFESDFEALSTHLQSTWEDHVHDTFAVEESGWLTSPSGNAKWQGILPAYWDQDPLDSDSTIRLYFRHAPTTDALRNRTLRFRLRLPPQRHVHTTPQDGGQSFNEVFTSLATSEYADRLDNALKPVGVDTGRVGSAGELCAEDYPLDPQNLAESYHAQLASAVSDFCTTNSDLVSVLNATFEEAYWTAFETEPAGTFPGPLQHKE